MFIGIDCGTQGTKAIVWKQGEIIGQGYSPHSTIMECTGQREQSPEAWFDAMVTAINAAFTGIEHHKSAVKGVGISGQQHGLVLLDRNDQVIRDALLWCDTRPHTVLTEYENSLKQPLVKQIGIQVPVAFTIAKLLWVKRFDTPSFHRIRKIMLPHDYLNWCLTGRYAIEPGDASGSGWFDTRSKSLNTAILESIFENSIEFEHPDVIQSHEINGTLKPNVAERLGLSTNVIVSSGGGDNMMAAIGTGNVDTGQLTISLGTSGTLFAHCHQQVDSREHPDLNAFCSSSNGYLPLASTMNVTTANNQILSLINSDISEFDTLIESSSVGADGLVCLPYFNGARLPNVPNARGALLGINANNLTPANLLRSTVEGVTYNLQRGASVLKHAGVTFETACVIGGGAKSDAWRQMIADVTNLPLWTPTCTEAAAVGAAIQACWAHENLYQRLDLATITQDVIAVDESKCVTPNSSNARQYTSLIRDYHDNVDTYMTQFS
jgi:xylulokinase